MFWLPVVKSADLRRSRSQLLLHITEDLHMILFPGVKYLRDYRMNAHYKSVYERFVGTFVNVNGCQIRLCCCELIAPGGGEHIAHSPFRRSICLPSMILQDKQQWQQHHQGSSRVTRGHAARRCLYSTGNFLIYIAQCYGVYGISL